MDVKNVILHENLKEEIYMEMHLGLRAIQINKHVFKLKKSLYSNQSPWKCYSKLSSKLIEEGFTRYTTDHSLFINSDHHDTTVIVVYVDDIIIAGNSETKINRAKDIMKEYFDMKDLGKLWYSIQ